MSYGVISVAPTVGQLFINRDSPAFSLCGVRIRKFFKKRNILRLFSRQKSGRKLFFLETEMSETKMFNLGIFTRLVIITC